MINALEVFERKDQAVVSSRTVALNFRKLHKNVLDSIRNLMAENSAVKPMFQEVPFKTLSVIMLLEDMILHTVDEEMEKGTYYKEIYRRCKENGLQIMKFVYLPKFAM